MTTLDTMASVFVTSALLAFLSGAAAQDAAGGAAAAPAAPAVTGSIRSDIPQSALVTGPGGYSIP